MGLEQRGIIPHTPRDRLVAFGPAALSTKELLTVVLGTGTTSEPASALVERLISEHESLIGLARLNFAELSQIPGVGVAKATQLQAVLELSRRVTQEVLSERPQVRTPSDAANLLMADMMHLDQESLRVMMLNTRNRVLGVHEVYKGNINTTMVRVSEIFREAIRRNSAALIVAHSHPSGEPNPSPEDVAVTREIIQAGKLLDIDVLDHLVIGQGRYVSLKERGLAFSE